MSLVASAGHALGDAEVVRVELGARSYDIVVGTGLLPRAGAYIAPLMRGRSAVVVSDETVARLHLDALGASLGAVGLDWRSEILPPGEQTKSFRGLEDLLDRLLSGRPDRSLMVIALGGGVIGDLAGFAASVLLRGVDLVQVPTTLLAQVDSSVGGKTGIDTRHGKNLVGSFHQPRLVLADTAALNTLPPRELRAGYAEVIKYGVIADAPFFDWLEANGKAVLAGDAAARRRVVVTSCRHKARIVTADEREAGERALLNLGHTFGHALETETGFGPELLHGEAVALGMVMALELSARLGVAPAAEAERLARHLRAVGLPARPREAVKRRLNARSLLAHMAFDKKVHDGRLTFVLARGIGRAFVARDVAPEAAREVLEAALAA